MIHVCAWVSRIHASSLCLIIKCINSFFRLFFLLSIVNEYVFMVQARGIQIRENVKNIGAQVLEQVVRGAYSINGTGKNMPMHTSLLAMFSTNAIFHILTRE